MEIISHTIHWQQIRKKFNPALQIGLVATMGNLHAGHASLLERSKQENDVSILSIYVNPAQFNEQQDLQNYPRTLEQDLQLAEKCQVDFVFTPNDQEMYRDQYYFQIMTAHPLSQIMEGIARPNHFTGVLTVVMKLLTLMKAHRAYFGEKDYQQLKLVEALANAFFLDTQIIACPTIRESSGLALSSRNNLLSSDDKMKAAMLSQILQQPLDCHLMKEKLNQYGFLVDYVEEHEQRIFAAVRLGQIRLIDNFVKTEIA